MNPPGADERIVVFLRACGRCAAAGNGGRGCAAICGLRAAWRQRSGRTGSRCGVETMGVTGVGTRR